MQKKNPTSINYEKPTVIHRINASWRAKRYQKKSYLEKKSYAGENVLLNYAERLCTNQGFFNIKKGRVRGVFRFARGGVVVVVGV